MLADTSVNDAHTQALSKLNEEYIRSVATSDVQWFERTLTEDFLNSNPDGSLVNRADFLAQIGRLAAVSNLKCEDVRIRIMDAFAIIHGRTTYTKPDGQAGAGRYTDIWALRDGRWQCVAAHVTRA
jgi:hypothetical protein